LITYSTPLFMKTYFSLDPVLHPSSWNLFTFIGSGIELAIRFPLETVLRRAQIATFTSPSIRQKSAGPLQPTTADAAAEAAEVETIVPTPQTYRGVVGTMWSIVYEEGVQPAPEAERAHELLGKPVQHRKRQGQGIHGLYRGWRMGMWGIAGYWGTSLLGNIAGSADDSSMPSGGRF
jgi:fusion and transport protein UGO1